MKKEYIEDLVFGERLLISIDADKTELNPNFDNDSPYACALCVRASISGLRASC